jgi:serine protease Do
MTRIQYEDSSLNKQSNYSRKNSSIAMMILVILVSLLLGAVGGIGGILLLSADGGVLAKKVGLNLSDISIPTTRTEKIVVEESNAIIDSANKASPAVVSITLKTTVQNIFGQSYEQEGAGTGFIITNDGLILTNKHVVSDSKARYTVVTTEGKSYEATVQSLDPVYDLAVIKIDAKNLPVVELGNSDDLNVGQWVVAIGNALGRFENTVTAGVISAKDRSIEASDSSGGSAESISNLLQTDAAINSGNSGGPLVNLKGQVVGINTAVASGAQSIGFAIPINQAKSAIESIKISGKIVRPYLGVRYLPITKEIAKDGNLPVDYGALIKGGNSITQLAVIPGSPADKAGLVENDIILEINGEKIDQNSSLLKLIQQYKVGDEVELKVLSKGKEKTIKIKLEEGK